MKTRALLASLLVFCSLSSLRADYPDTITADAPLAYYRFEEAAASTTIGDSSGNGYDGDVTVGSSIFESPGLFGNALDFAGDTSILTTLDLDPSIGDFSIEAIIKSTTFGGAQVFIANTDGTGLGRSNGVLVGSLFQSFTGGVATNTAPLLQLDTWHHLVITYDRSGAEVAGATIRLYVDGELSATGTAVAESADGGWVIGSHKNQDVSFFIGLIDELSVWDKRLDDPDADGDESDSLIESHYKEFVAETEVLLEFGTDNEFVVAGEAAQLSWYVSPALTALTLDDGTGPVDVLGDTIDCRSVRTVNPAATTTYRLIGTSPIGTEELVVTIRVNEPPLIDSFTSDQDVVVYGNPVTLSWAVTNAETAEIDNGVGAIDPVSGMVTTTFVETVSGDTVYTLTATNAFGSATMDLLVRGSRTDQSLLGHWRVGEDPSEISEGGFLQSESEDDFDGDFVGSPSFDTTDPAPVPSGSTASIIFDGASSVGIRNWTGVTGGEARTVAFWFKGPASQPTNNATLVSWGTGATGMRFDVRLSGNARNGTFRVEVAGSGRDSSLILADDTWHHAAVVLADDGSPNVGEIQFYIDGVLDVAAVGGNTPINTATTQNVSLGDANVFARPLTGKMDDIRIYDRALTPGEILELVEPNDVEFEITGIRRLENGEIEISWTAPPGEYSVEYSFDLKGWNELTDPTIPGGQSSSVTIDNRFSTLEENTRIYYRILVVE